MSTKNKRKKKTKKKKKIDNSIIQKEILGILIIAFGIFNIVNIHSTSMGIIGEFIKQIILQLTGYGSYIIPYFILAIGVFLILSVINLYSNQRIVSILLIYFSYLSLLDIMEFNFETGLSFIEKINLALEYGKEIRGGGLIGSLFSYIFVKLFGIIGSYIVISSIILIAFLLLTNISFLKLLSFISTTFISLTRNCIITIKDFIFIEKKQVDKNENKKIKKETNLNKKIEILDYTRDNIKTDKKTNDNKTNNKKEKNSDKKQNSNKKQNNDKEQITVNNNNKFENFKFPNMELLKISKKSSTLNEKKRILAKAKKLEKILSNFGIKSEVIQISKGPSITRFELQPAPGVKVSKIVNLSNDIALGLACSDIRIEAPIPDKSAIGIEIPNESKNPVRLREVLESSEYEQMKTKIPFALGKDITGKSIIENIEKMPHLLIAGATGSGKSVCINALITSIIYKARPNEVKLLLIDPKVVELNIYNGIPHLIIPVVTDPKKASSALNWAVEEMTKRYKLFAENNTRDFSGYNDKVDDDKKLPQIVVIIDELADLMMVAPNEVEDSICRLAQMARAAGIHLIIATQRPSVDVITGTIKANIPSRLSFAVSSQADSRTILGFGGAEKLLGKGDMLYYPVGASKPKRIQGAFIEEDEVEGIVNYLVENNKSKYSDEVIDNIENDVNDDLKDCDELLPKAIELVVKQGQASISYLQRKLKIGHSRAARLVDAMEERGIVGGYEGSKPRKVLVTKDELDI